MIETTALTAWSVLDAAPDAIVGVADDGCIVLVNAQTEALFGYTRDELIGQPVEILVPESARAIHPSHRAAYFARPLTRPMGECMDLAGRRRDGSEFPAEISLSSIEIEGGLLVSAAIRDVTERKRVEAKFRGMLEAAPDAIVGVDEDGRIELVNARVETLFGYPRDALIGQPVEILVPDLAQAIHPRHRNAHPARRRTRPMASNMELAGRRRDGSEFPAEISLSSMETETGLLVSAAIRDGTDRKRAAIVASSSEPIISLTIDRTITSWNPAAERLYGCVATDVLGHSIDIVISEDRREREHALFVRVARGEAVRDYETIHVRKDLTPLDVSVTMSPITNAAGAVTGVSAIARDITERKRAEVDRRALEDELHQSQRLESLGQLAGGVAHDFNNLLAVILNYASFAAEEIKENDAAREDIEQIRIAAERAARLTHQLLIFGRRETIQPEILDLNAIVTDVQLLLSRTIGEHVELDVRLGESAPPIRADRGQMEQVLMNLAVNARDAMPEGGRLTIETRSFVLDEDYKRLHPEVATGPYVQLSVSDTGTGMSDAVRAHVFEPFFSTKPRGEGSGLGLATVYGIVVEAGGSVSVNSEEGLGTTVRIHLPAVQDALSSRPAEPVAETGGSGETVLVVEDEEAMRRVTARILRRNGYDVLEAATAEEALALEATHDCDLLLTDVVMPLISGPELVERMRTQHPELPVLFMSGYSLGVLGPQRVLSAGTMLIEKPFNESSLLKKVRTVMADAHHG